MLELPKLRPGDKVAIVSPSFAAPGKFPHMYELGLTRLREEFGLVPVEYPATKKLGASKEERAADLVAAFSDPEIKAIISTIGGDDQVTYIKNLPAEPFLSNPKPYFGFSDNSHFMNFLWLNGIPSYYGGALFIQFAMVGGIDPYTKTHLEHALFTNGEVELTPSAFRNEETVNWTDPDAPSKALTFEENEGWYWSGEGDAEGITWGGCVESIDELLRHGIAIPSLERFSDIVLILETSEEIPEAAYVRRVLRALGERGYLERVKGVLVGRPKAWEFDKQNDKETRDQYRKEQREMVEKVVREYNPTAPIVQNLDFGHTNPQIPLPYGRNVRILGSKKRIFADF